MSTLNIDEVLSGDKIVTRSAPFKIGDDQIMLHEVSAATFWQYCDELDAVVAAADAQESSADKNDEEDKPVGVIAENQPRLDSVTANLPGYRLVLKSCRNVSEVADEDARKIGEKFGIKTISAMISFIQDLGGGIEEEKKPSSEVRSESSE